MIKKILSASAVGVLCMASLAFASTDDKVQVCHFTSSESNPVETISVSSNAVQAHVAHGDDCGIIPG